MVASRQADRVLSLVYGAGAGAGAGFDDFFNNFELFYADWGTLKLLVG